jgi:hypothetical protein
LNWEVIAKAGQMKSLEIFLNFPVMDMNQNVLWRNPENVEATQIARMDAFWGSDTWKKAVYETEGNLFGWEEKVLDAPRGLDSFHSKKRIGLTAISVIGCEAA